MYNKYPSTDFHELNLDWIIASIKSLKENLENFIKINTIKYADPIQWNITAQYEANTVVIDGLTGTAYLSVKPVPTGVSISDTDYWTPIFTLDLASVNQNITLRDDGYNTLSTFASDAGDWLLWQSTLYKVLTPIGISTAYAPGVNIERYTVELFISDYISNLETMIGDLSTLTTSDTSSVVNAINSIVNDITNIGIVIGTLTDLQTVDKSSIVNAINSLYDYECWIKPESFGAIGDGVADDSDSLINCIAAAKAENKNILLTKTYRITKQLKLFSGLHIAGQDASVICQYISPEATAREAGNFDCTGCTDVIIENINFIGAGASTSAYVNAQMIGGNGASNITVCHCTFKDVNQEGAVIFFASNNCLVDHCYIENYTFTGVGFLNRSNNCTVSHTSIKYGYLTRPGNTHIDRYAIMLSGWDESPAPTPMPENNAALYNYIEDSVGEWEGIDAHGGYNLRVIGNVIINCAIPIAVFTDAARLFYARDCEIANNICVQKQSNMNTNKLFYCGGFSGEFINIHDNIFRMEWDAQPTSTSLGAYSGVVIGGNRLAFKNNTIINAPNAAVVLANGSGYVDIEGNSIMTTFTFTNKPVAVAPADGVVTVNAKVHGNFIGTDPYKEVSVNASSIIVFFDNIYDLAILNWNSGTRELPDRCTQAELPSIHAVGHLILNASPSAGSPSGWLSTSNAWLSIGTLA